MDASMSLILAPSAVFGGDVGDRVTAGDMEGDYTSGVKDGWIISQTPGHGVSGSVNEASVHGGSSAQQILVGSTADGSIGFAQQLAGLDTDNDYGATAWIESLEAQHTIVFRVGPASADQSFQASATATQVGSFQQVELTWSNTAADPWLYVTTIADAAVTGGFIVDDISVRSASAQTMDATTATNAVLVGINSWSLMVPGGVTAPASGSPFRLEASNANSLDPSKASHYINPTMWAIQSVGNKQPDQSAAANSDFENTWVNIGDLTASAHSGTQCFRWIRVVQDASFTGTASAFKAYVWTDYQTATLNR